MRRHRTTDEITMLITELERKRVGYTETPILPPNFQKKLVGIECGVIALRRQLEAAYSREAAREAVEAGRMEGGE